MATRKNEKFTAEQVAKALINCHGLVSPAARSIGCSPQTIRNYRDRYKSVAAAIEDARENFIDQAESMLGEKIAQGDTTAVIFALKTLGKSRGYVERAEVTGKDGGAIETRELTKTEREATELDAEIARLERQFDKSNDASGANAGAGATEEGAS